MGIEDFQIDSEEHTEKILIVANSESTKEVLRVTLEKRAYHTKIVTNLEWAAKEVLSEIYDCMIYEPPCFRVPIDETVENVRSEQRLFHLPLIVLHPGAHETDGARLSSNVQIVKTPVNPAEVLVKVSTMLRLRKIQAESAEFEAKVAAQNAQLRDLTNRFKQELKEARSIQRSILPTILPKHHDCYFAATFVPLEAVAGDVYDIWEIDAGRFGLFIGDVTGHGLPAAFIGAMTKMSLAYASKTCPAKMLSEMCVGISPLMPEGRFVTVAAAIYDSNDNTLKVARGGHPPPLIYRHKTQTVDVISPKGLPLGIIPEARYEVYETVLDPGDQFLMITDGLIETPNMSGQMLGVEGVADWFRKAGTENHVADCIKLLLKWLKAYSEGRRVKDDNTLVGLERRVPAS